MRDEASGHISLCVPIPIYFAHRRERERAREQRLVSDPFGKKLIAGALLRSAASRSPARPTAADRRRINHFGATLPPAPETQYFCSCALFNESRPEICGPRSDGVHEFLHFARPETRSLLLLGSFSARKATNKREMGWVFGRRGESIPQVL